MGLKDRVSLVIDENISNPKARKKIYDFIENEFLGDNPFDINNNSYGKFSDLDKYKKAFYKAFKKKFIIHEDYQFLIDEVKKIIDDEESSLGKLL
jgi:hypothetical protein